VKVLANEVRCVRGQRSFTKVNAAMDSGRFQQDPIFPGFTVALLRFSGEVFRLRCQ